MIDADPLTKMLPVDEYLPIMYNRHPNTTWSQHFPVRNLKALSVHPLLVHPTHYTGEAGYISDTEDTVTIDTGERETGMVLGKANISYKQTILGTQQVKDEL